MRGVGSLSGGFNTAKLTQPVESDWKLGIGRTGGTGNHGVIALVPMSEGAKIVAGAVKQAYFEGIVDTLKLSGWKMFTAGMLNITPPAGADESGLMSLYAHRLGDGTIMVKHEWLLPPGFPEGWTPSDTSVCVYGRLVIDRTGGSLPDIYDRYFYWFVRVGKSGTPDCIQALTELGILVEDEEDDE